MRSARAASLPAQSPHCPIRSVWCERGALLSTPIVRSGAKASRGNLEKLAKTAAEVRNADKAAGDGDIGQRLVGLLQQLSGTGQAQLQVVARGRRIDVAAEQALELAPGNAHAAGEFIHRQRLVRIVVHQLPRRLP